MRRILLVEDDRALQRLLEKALAGFGAVECFFSGEDALLHIEKNPAPPVTAAIIDLGLPGMSGVRLCESLRAEPACSDSVILVVSGRTSVQDHALALEAGADHFLPKPLKPRAVEEAIKVLLAERGQAP
jgi:DNA-binding response OmpR family regulator